MPFGSEINPPNRFEKIRYEVETDQIDRDDGQDDPIRSGIFEYLVDESKSIVSKNNSPDLPFEFSLNPYRGCAHGCAYCYARPTHEFLGFSAGLDFETKIVVKPDAPKLFREWLKKRKSPVEPVLLSGVTDPYQMAESKFKLTRQCLEIAVESRQPMLLITKNRLIRRDIDLLSNLAKLNLVSVTISVTSLDQSLIRVMEPRTSSPHSRLETISQLSSAGVPVCVFVAPVIPGLNDQEIPQILAAASQAGASAAEYVVLRLPSSVEPVFVEWTERNFPDRKTKIIDRVKSLRGGKVNDSTFGRRMVGQGVWADQIRNVFSTFAQKYGLQKCSINLRTDLFRITDNHGFAQAKLF